MMDLMTLDQVIGQWWNKLVCLQLMLLLIGFELGQQYEDTIQPNNTMHVVC